MAATKRGRVQMQGTWPISYFSSHMGGKKTPCRGMAGIADACLLSPCLEQHLDSLCFSLPAVKHQFFNWKKQQSPDQHTVLINARAVAPTPNSLEITATVKCHGGKKSRNSSLSGSAHTSRHRCVPKLEIAGISLEKVPTS